VSKKNKPTTKGHYISNNPMLRQIEHPSRRLHEPPTPQQGTYQLHCGSLSHGVAVHQAIENNNNIVVEHNGDVEPSEEEVLREFEELMEDTQIEQVLREFEEPTLQTIKALKKLNKMEELSERLTAELDRGENGG